MTTAKCDGAVHDGQMSDATGTAFICPRCGATVYPKPYKRPRPAEKPREGSR